jgi:dTDP-4-dehydrorhamnose reductase
VPDVVTVTRQLLQASVPYGTYHCVNAGSTTWYELACEIARLLNLPAVIHPITSVDLKLAAPRPRFCALSNEKLRAAGVAMPDWRSALLCHLDARGAAAGVPGRRMAVPAAG